MEMTQEFINKALTELRRQKQLIKMQMTRDDFECLTIINGERRENGVDYFVIDYPAEFEQISDGSDQNVLFEFTDIDKQHFVFETSLRERENGEIWVRRPERMERLQRRKNFRIEAPEGTYIRVENGPDSFRRQVLDVSLGGTLIVVALEKEDRETMPNLEVGDELQNLELNFSSGPQRKMVRIQKAEVVRLDEEEALGLHQCAIEFTRLRMGEEKTLTDIIYQVQRQFLRERLKVDL